MCLSLPSVCPGVASALLTCKVIPSFALSLGIIYTWSVVFKVYGSLPSISPRDSFYPSESISGSYVGSTRGSKFFTYRRATGPAIPDRTISFPSPFNPANRPRGSRLCKGITSSVGTTASRMPRTWGTAYPSDRL